MCVAWIELNGISNRFFWVICAGTYALIQLDNYDCSIEPTSKDCSCTLTACQEMCGARVLQPAATQLQAEGSCGVDN